MSIKTMEIVEQLKGLTLLETSELVKQIEITFNIDASPIVISDTSTSKEDLNDDSLPLQTEFDVVLEVVPSDKKIAILKVITVLRQISSPKQLYKRRIRRDCDAATRQNGKTSLWETLLTLQ